MARRRDGPGAAAAGGAAGGVDLHTHLMPAVDDGARDPEEAAGAASRLREAGVGTAVSTPHLAASLLGSEALARRMEAFDEAWERLVEVCRDRCPGLSLERGVELRLDEADPVLSDPRLRLAGGPSVLVEFNRFEIPPYGARQLEDLSRGGWRPVLAHPERYVGIMRRMDRVVPEWREAGAALLVNAGSLLGAHGPEPRDASREMLRRGWVDALASDYHARGELPWTAALETLREMESGSTEQARLLFRTNPGRLLEGEAPLPVPPLEDASSVWTRLRRWLG